MRQPEILKESQLLNCPGSIDHRFEIDIPCARLIYSTLPNTSTNKNQPLINNWLFYCLCNFTFSEISYSSNHTVHSLFRLASFTKNMNLRFQGSGTPLQYSCLENPMDGGAWWAADYGVAQSRTRLKWFSSSIIGVLGLSWWLRG